MWRVTDALRRYGILAGVPFYAVLAIAMGKLDRLFGVPVAVWNPFEWSSSNVINVSRDLVGSAAFAGVRPITPTLCGSTCHCAACRRTRPSVRCASCSAVCTLG